MSWYTEKIRRLRMDQGLSLQALADKSGSISIQLEAPEPPQAMAPNRPRRRSIASQFLNNTG